MKKFGLSLLLLFPLLILGFQNCGEVVLLGGIQAVESRRTDTPSLPDIDETEDPNEIDIGYSSPDSSAQSPAAGTPDSSWQNMAENQCISHVTSNAGYPNNNLFLSRFPNPPNPNCPTPDRPAYEDINGCRVYSYEEINQFAQQRNLQPWLLGHHYLTANLPLVMHGPYETVSFKIPASKFLEAIRDPRYEKPIYRGDLQLYYDVHALISVGTKPCKFKKVVAKDACQRFSDRMAYGSRDSDPGFVRFVDEHPEYGYCLLDSVDRETGYYYVNIRFVRPEDLGDSTKSTISDRTWHSYHFGFR